MSMLAAASAALAVLLWSPSGRWIARRRLGPHRRASGRRPPLPLTLLAVVGALFALVTTVSSAHAIVLITCVGVLAFGVAQWRKDRARRSAVQRADAVAEAIGLLTAELRAGILPQRALAGLAADFGFLAPAAHAADLGGDVALALREAAIRPGMGLMADLASAWLVAERAGAPVARVLERLEETAREDREILREVQSGAAPARATGRLMAVLPVFGLALGSGMGGDPVEVLTDTLLGALCLAVGAALACAGVVWIDRIAAGAEGAR